MSPSGCPVYFCISIVLVMVESTPYGFVQVVSLCVRSNLLEGEGVEFGEECTAHERKGK